ncbi:MAG: hypothetical protein LBM77_01275 [Spirochaetaceae bacterium]|jgi:predicted nucleic acid-binding protein|nr:hypothetical protein [Spirochaetaceae bacterium]
MVYAFDTNIISFDIKNLFGIRELIEAVNPNGDEWLVPPISLYEIKRGFYLNNSGQKLEYFNRRFAHTARAKLDVVDFELAAKIYSELIRQGHSPEDDDIFQAAFCINRGYTLVTHNPKHFEHIPGLKYEDWVK